METERRQRAIVRTTTRHAGAKEIAIGQQHHRHKRTVTVPTHTHALLVAYTHIYHRLDRGLRVGDDLFHERVVRRAHRACLAHHGHRHLIEHRVAFEREEPRRGTGKAGESMGRVGHLPGHRAARKFARVRPQNRRQHWPLRIIQIVVRRQVQQTRKFHAILARVSEQSLFHFAQRFGGVLERRDRRAFRFAHRALGIIRMLLGRFEACHKFRPLIIQQRHHRLVAVLRALEDRHAVEGAEV